MSSNLISFCLNRKIPIDFFDNQGTHLGSIINSKYMQNTLWAKQADAETLLRNTIAFSIIEGKIKNQHALLKYFNKYHKSHYPQLQPKMKMMEEVVERFKQWRKQAKPGDEGFLKELVSHEAQVAIRYWDYIRELFSDDNVSFTQREHQGAKDFVNSMLNYGYAILYVRIWQALLAAKLNPFESLIHIQRARMNFSVFECMLTDVQYRNMCRQLEKLIVKHEDWVNIYPLCTECYARITYIPDIKKKELEKIVVI